MIDKNSIHQYQCSSHKINDDTIMVLPHKSLQPYIANYTFTSPINMPKQQTILPPSVRLLFSL